MCKRPDFPTRKPVRPRKGEHHLTVLEARTTQLGETPRPRSTVVDTEGPRNLLPTQGPDPLGQLRPRRPTPFTMRVPAHRERTRGRDQSADAYGPKGGDAANQRGAGGEGAGAAEARVRPNLGLPSLPGAVRPGPEATCGEAAASSRGPDPLPRARPSPSVAPPQPPCSLRASPRTDTEIEMGVPSESCS